MRTSGRVGLTVTVAAVLLLLCAAPSFAVPGIPSDGIAQGGYLDPVAGESPHGSYSTTTNKCKVCHAVHGAVDGGEVLLRSPNVYVPAVPQTWDPLEDNHSTPCVYCHVGGPFTITQVYDNDPDLYYMETAGGGSLNYLNNHSSSHGRALVWLPQTPGGTYEGCPSCHSVHGAGTWDPNTGDADPSTYILRADPGPSLTGPVTNMDDFCRDCHDMSGQNGANNPQAGGSCGGHCHQTWRYDPTTPAGNVWTRALGWVTKTGARDGQSHIMTTTLTNVQGQDRAMVGSQTCRSCHKGGDHTAGNSWPHLTAGAAFLADYHTVATQLDRVCLDCHDDGVQNGTFGVGDSF